MVLKSFGHIFDRFKYFHIFQYCKKQYLKNLSHIQNINIFSKRNILTGTIITINMGWNTGFSLVTNVNKGCFLLMVLKLNV